MIVFITEPCVVRILQPLHVCCFWTKTHLANTTAELGFCAACVAGILKGLTFFPFRFLVCMLAFMLVCEFLYIYTDPILLFWIEIRTIPVSCLKDLLVGHLNIDHLANKVTDVNVFVHQSFYIFLVSESMFTSYVSDEVVSIPNYSILRRDADEPGHTGIAVYMYVHNSIRDFTHRRYDLESVYVESIWLQVKTGRGPPFLKAFIYRSPSSTLEWFDEFVVMMDRVQNSKHHNEILLLGDFNTDMFKPNPAWVSTLSLFNLHQCVQSLTRVTSTTSALIDHIYMWAILTD